MFNIKKSEQNQMSMSSIASSMVSISSSSEEQNSDNIVNGSGKSHGSHKNSNKDKNRSGSVASDNEKCECYHNNKKRRPAKVRRCFGNAYLCMPPNLLCFKVGFLFCFVFS